MKMYTHASKISLQYRLRNVLFYILDGREKNFKPRPKRRIVVRLRVLFKISYEDSHPFSYVSTPLSGYNLMIDNVLML